MDSSLREGWASRIRTSPHADSESTLKHDERASTAPRLHSASPLGPGEESRFVRVDFPRAGAKTPFGRTSGGDGRTVMRRLLPLGALAIAVLAYASQAAANTTAHVSMT